MFYKFAIAVVRVLMLFVMRVKTVGKENVPKEGGMILAVNHRSNLDPVIAGLTCPRQLTFMAKAELFKNPVFGKLIKSLGAFPIERGKGDIGAIKSAFSIVKGGGAMLIFPEGRRVKDGIKPKAKPGVAMIAQRGQVPVVPVFISGEYKWMHKITVTYGKPIDLSEYYGQKIDSEKIQEIADDILTTMYDLTSAN